MIGQLERIPQSKLQLARPDLVVNLHEVRAAWIGGGDVVPVRMVDPIERFGSKLNAMSLGDREVFEYPEIVILIAGVVEPVAKLLSRESASGRSREDRA